MDPILRRHSTRFLFALLCVLLLTRLPPVGLAEDAWSSSATSETGVMFVAEVTPGAAGLFVRPLMMVGSVEALSASSRSDEPPAHREILRL